ncbi:MAG: hypothetical protein KJO67_01615 [Silicimonas sp.]|nr:hypothetical protein [Silicimonas sp.]NND22503.1 hypothetical protein [Silicimonas sp.]NND42865.1 hypothetical protein [Silicimonas sp.]
MSTNDRATTVLVLEDEVIVGMDIAMSLEEAGFSVQGPFKSAEKAKIAAEETLPAFAVLDLNLGNNQTSEEVAWLLSEKNCPFIFLTGYEASSHPVIRKFGHAECFSKPVNLDAITKKIRSVVG